jgi:hypothetical protein
MIPNRGRGVGDEVLVSEGSGVKVRVGASVGVGVIEAVGVSVSVVVGVNVAVLVGDGVSEAVGEVDAEAVKPGRCVFPGWLVGEGSASCLDIDGNDSAVTPASTGKVLECAMKPRICSPVCWLMQPKKKVMKMPSAAIRDLCFIPAYLINCTPHGEPYTSTSSTYILE